MKSKVLIFSVVIVLVVCSLALFACNKQDVRDIYPAWVYDSSLYEEDAEMTEGADARIMSYNVLVEAWNTNPLRQTGRKDNASARIEQAGKMIDYYSPDVVGLQETCEKWHGGLMDVIGEHYSFVDGFDGIFDYTSMIYNHDKVELIESGRHKYTKRSEFRMRYVAWALFERKSDARRFVVLNTHFDFGGDAKKREMQTQQMKEFAHLGKELLAKYGVPVFMLGDYNAYESEVTDENAPNFDYTQAVDLYEMFARDVKDAFVDANYLDNIVIRDGKNAKYDDAKWDHIFVSAPAIVRGYAILSNDYYTSISDHYPVFVDVAL